MDFMNDSRPIIIGIDHGYGNIKTAHTCFKTGVTAHDKESTFKSNLLICDGHCYTTGEGHKEFTADKMADSDYYIALWLDPANGLKQLIFDDVPDRYFMERLNARVDCERLLRSAGSHTVTQHTLCVFYSLG